MIRPGSKVRYQNETYSVLRVDGDWLDLSSRTRAVWAPAAYAEHHLGRFMDEFMDEDEAEMFRASIRQAYAERGML